MAANKRTRKASKKAQEQADADARNAAIESLQHRRPPTDRLDPPEPPIVPIPPPSGPLDPPVAPPAVNPYTAQLQLARQELEQGRQAYEAAMLRDREELFRLQNEIHDMRGRQQSLPPPLVHQSMPQIPQQPLPLLFAPPLQPSPMPPPAAHTSFTLPQQRSQTPSETDGVPRRSFLHQVSRIASLAVTRRPRE